MPKYTTTLSAKGFRNLAEQVRKYRNALPEKCEEFARRLAQEGVKIAQMKIKSHDAVFTGDLMNSVKFEVGDIIYNGGSYFVYTDCEWAKFVEFGTGIVGKESPHPDTSIASWKYDVNEHGEKGWWYYHDGEFHWTKGMPSRPFMYETAMSLRDMNTLIRIAKEVFDND